MSVNTERQYLTTTDVARQLGVDHHQVLFWINNGLLPAVDLSKEQHIRPRWHIKITDLDAFIASRMKTPPGSS